MFDVAVLFKGNPFRVSEGTLFFKKHCVHLIGPLQEEHDLPDTFHRCDVGCFKGGETVQFIGVRVNSPDSGLAGIRPLIWAE